MTLPPGAVLFKCHSQAPRFGRIATERVAPDPDQPRTHFDEDAIARLASSLKMAGQLAPIHVRWSDERQLWLIIAGERRWRAAQLAGLTEVECCFREGPIDESEVLRLQLIENLVRENLRPMEEARGYQRLMQSHGFTGKQLAAELSVPESKVSRSLALLRLPTDIQSQVDDGRIAPRVAYEIAKAPTPSEQRRIASQAAAGQLRLGDVQQLVRPKKRPGKRKPAGVTLTFLTEGGWKVSVSRRTPGNYYEVEEALVESLEDVRARIKAGICII
ncbi:MAG: ParB/RepB/Spo0J family partition protein [Pirellulales bacterium]|nr:ParB/RepB/Spo0J family partition protein [Pirellulales bacterium]